MPSPDDIAFANQSRIDNMHRCRSGQTALLVIDMQRGFLDPGAALEVPEGRQIIPNVRRLSDVCRQKGVPVIFSQFVYSSSVPCLRGDPFGIEHLPADEGQPTGFGHASRNCLIGPGSDDGPNSADVAAELAPLPNELVEELNAL
ncbi:MAG: isochorismatase family protein [Pirellulales bacterium]